MPHSNTLIKEWPGPMERLTTKKGKRKKIEVNWGSSYLDNSHTSKKYSYVLKNYMGKITGSHPMEEAPEK